jgi:hypothetical protein
MGCVKWVHGGLRSGSQHRSMLAKVVLHLDIKLPHVEKERPDAIIIFGLMQQNEFHIFNDDDDDDDDESVMQKISARSALTSRSNKSRYSPFVEFFHSLEIPGNATLNRP